MKIARYEPLVASSKESWVIAADFAGVQPDTPVERYHPASNAVGFFPSHDGAFSWCRTIPEGYDRSVMLPGCRLIDTAWSIDWLSCVARGLREGGQLILPYRSDGKASEPAGLTPRQLDEVLSKPSRVESGFAAFDPDGRPRRFKSIAGHFMIAAASWVGRLAEYRAAELQDGLKADDWRASNAAAWIIDDSAGLKPITADFLSETFADLARYLVFAVQGINAKSFSLLEAFRNIFAAGENLRWADLGSGSGFLGIELAAHQPVHAFNIDKSLAQSRVGVDMMQCFPYFKGECTFITTRLENAELPKELDAVSMLTTLCYVPKEARRPLLRRCWDALRPGGALLILENIKSRAYTRDYDLMFEEAELDGMLEELGGEKRYYHALTGSEMVAETAIGKNCYRVRIKP